MCPTVSRRTTRRRQTAAPPAKSRVLPHPVHADYMDKPAHLRTRQERLDAGKAMRVHCPRESQGGFAPHPDRPDPIELLIESSQGRIPDLVPIRYGRMLASPFAFYRGAAMVMAADLAPAPCTDVGVQACGDAHLANFGAFATPERRIVFDINDFDETFPAPWEWDLKRLAASFVIASRHNSHPAEACRAAATHAVREYAARMREITEMKTLDAWYTFLDWEELIEAEEDEELKRRRKKVLAKAIARDASAEFTKLAVVSDGRPRIKDTPPLVFHLPAHLAPGFDELARQHLLAYRESLPRERRVLLDRYEIADVAMKVVGVGSVGTRCAIALLFAAEDDPLFLQIKEARPSVLEPYVDFPPFASNGERVVLGQRLMQASSDLFLGHFTSHEGIQMYVRQLRDVKIKPMIELYTPQNMANYARCTGWALARAHARSGDAAVISGYIGKSDVFADAIAQFACDYADQNERDHAALREAVRSGRVEAMTETGAE